MNQLIFLHAAFLVLVALIAFYHWVWARAIRRMETQMGMSLSAFAQRLMSVNVFLIFSFTTLVLVVMVFNVLLEH